jgi:hypothetical protein
MTERIAGALEVIASRLAAASPAPGSGDSFGSADAFVWVCSRVSIECAIS